jgi:5-methylthioribose kinase
MKLSEANAVEYLHSRGLFLKADLDAARELSGGVSNVVIHVATGDGDLVLKQARGQLATAQTWFCSVDRIFREVEVMVICQKVLAEAHRNSPLAMEVPRLIFEDRGNYTYAMSAARRDHVVWKSELLSGVVRDGVAESCGTMLGVLHASTWHDTDVAKRLDDRRFFDELRLDPYYRHVARVHNDLRPTLEQLIESLWRERHCLVHGDFSPKNLLLDQDRLLLIDFEVGHYGDPAFDLGFFLTHLVLKAYFHAPRHARYLDLADAFWAAYSAELKVAISDRSHASLISRSIMNFAGCALARLDGKSPVDYLNDAGQRESVRELCRTIFDKQPNDWADVRSLVESSLTHFSK